jgi:hypothetical protein
MAIMNNGTTKGCRTEVFDNLKRTASLQAVCQVHKNLRPDSRNEQRAGGPKSRIWNVNAGGTTSSCRSRPTAPLPVSIPANGHERTFDDAEVRLAELSPISGSVMISAGSALAAGFRSGCRPESASSRPLAAASADEEGNR